MNERTVIYGEPKPNVLDAGCGSRRVLNMIADNWTILVIYALGGGTMRHGELMRTVGGISQKMLTQTLRRLERDGIVSRKVYPVVPPKVEYRLTPLGERLLETLGTLCAWAEENWDEVERARSRSSSVR